MNTNSGFSPERGFFRAADKGAGGGGEGKDGDGAGEENQERQASVLDKLKHNLQEIDKLLRKYERSDAKELLEQSKKLVESYEPSSEEEKNALLFFIDRLKLKAKRLYYKWEDSEEEKTSSSKKVEDSKEKDLTEKDDSNLVSAESGSGNSGSGNIVERLDDKEGKKPPWQIKFDRLWDELQDTYRETASSSPDIRDLTSQLTDIVEEHFSEEEKRAYRRTLLMRDVANPNAVFRHLCCEDFEAARKKSYLNEAYELRNYMDLEDVFGVSIKEVVNYLESNAFDNIEHKITKEDGSVGVFRWDYAANGDPEEEYYAHKSDGSIDFSHFPNEDAEMEALQQFMGELDQDETIDSEQKEKEIKNFKIQQDKDWKGRAALTLQELIENKFPKLKEVPKFVSDSLITFVIVSELRYHKFYPYYNYYQNSPINGMNAGALLPWGVPGYLGYKAASIQKIPGYNSILMLTRHPDQEKLKKICGFEGNNEEVEALIKAKYEEVPFEQSWARGRFMFKNNNDTGVLEKNEDSGKKIRQYEYVDSRTDTFKGDSMADKEYKKSRFKKALVNRATMVEVRNALCWMFSPDVDFGSVILHPDMQLLPSPWDVIKGKWRGEDIKITLDDLFEVYEQFDQFAKEVDNVPNITQPMQAMTFLSDLISNTSRFKVIFAKLENSVFKELEKLVELMYMFYIKKLFDQYIKLPKMKGLSYKLTPKHKIFAQEVMHEVEFDRTLPKFIKEFILKAMKQVDIIPSGKWGIVFYPPTTEDETPLFIKYQQFLGSDFAKTLNRWLKPAKPAEKDPNQ